MLDLLFRGRTLAYKSTLGMEEIAARLRREIAPPKWQLRETRRQLFEGTFADGRFRMMRLVRGRNSFRPVIDGQLAASPQGVRIVVRLRLHPVVVGFCAVMAGFGGLVAAVAVPEFLTTGTSPASAFVLGMAILLAVFVGAASLEARKATRLLAALFEAEPVA